MKEVLEYLQKVGIEISEGKNELEQVQKLLLKAREEGKSIFVAGNGGSASTASHFVNDLVKGLSMKGRKRFKAMALCDNVAIVTALANDIAYEDIYVEQLKNYMEPGDVLVAISGSGNSENVVRAAKYAKKTGAIVISFTGAGGGKLKECSDVCCMTQTSMMEQIEDIHLVWFHTLIAVMRTVIQQREI